MANRYHNLDHQNSLNGPPKKPGLVYREQQVAELQRDIAPANEASGLMRGALGSSTEEPTHRSLRAAKRALKRQQQYAAGQYPSGR